MISAEILKDSINIFNNRVTTFRLKYHRYILAELNTFRMASKNTASSRAIPIKDNIDRVLNNPVMPIEWGKNQPGMVADELIENVEEAKNIWKKAAELNSAVAEKLSELKVHKQIVNRILEPYSTVETVLTATDFDNFFKLRIDENAQPEIYNLALLMYNEYEKSTPTLLKTNQWHLPYIECYEDSSKSNGQSYYINNHEINLDTAIKVSISCLAQVSYRKLDTSVAKALNIFKKLFDNPKTPHSSPAEHVCTPFSEKEYEIRNNMYKYLYDELFNELSNIDMESVFYKRNFKGWTQYRTLIPNDTFTKKFII